MSDPVHAAELRPYPGALVISLDFELQWGVRERMTTGAYRQNLLGAREAVPRILELFAEFEVAATWATVGFLFAESDAELREHSPAVRPGYVDHALDPYPDPIGRDEADDPLHFAPTLLEAIRRTPRQEVATHTFSHFYCQEPGQTGAAFDADLAAANSIAKRYRDSLTSIVFPRNQHNPAYDAILTAHGITAYRGNPRSRMWQFEGARDSASLGKRLARALDSYIGSSEAESVPWSEILQPNGLCDVRASRFLAPYRPSMRAFEPLRLRRITRGLRVAATRQAVYHLWWHPHNFGADVDANLRCLRQILDEFDRCRSLRGMQSLSMADVAAIARGETVGAAGVALA